MEASEKKGIMLDISRRGYKNIQIFQTPLPFGSIFYTAGT